MDKDEQPGGGGGGSVDDESADERHFDETENFERKYNFRFEEAGGTDLVSYPRNPEDSVRRKDTKRADKRKERKERKQLEKTRKQEELGRLKSLKRAEILAKLKTIRELSGVDLTAAAGAGKGDDADGNGAKDKAEAGELDAALDLEGEFDPEAHDRKMAEVFAEDKFYRQDDDLGDEKPVFSDDDIDWDQYDPDGDDGGDKEPEGAHYGAMDAEAEAEEAPAEPTEKQLQQDKKKKRKKKKKQEENEWEPDFNMDADYVEGDEEYEQAEAHEEPAAQGAKAQQAKESNRKTTFREAARRKKPTFDPDQVGVVRL